MKKKWLHLLIMIIFLTATLPLKVQAALSLSDTLSTLIPNTAANHNIQWTVGDGGGIQEGESFTLDFASEFNTASIAVGDVDLSDDGTDISLAANCAGAEKIGFVNNADNTFTFTICAGDGGAIANASVVIVKIGTNATGGSNQIVNPPAAGGYLVNLNGTGGYIDDDKLNVVIMSGGTTSFTLTITGDLRFIGFASPNAVVYFREGGSVIGTDTANANSYFDKTITGFTPGIHLISMYATDVGAVSTLTISFNINVVAGVTTVVSGIILPPTFTLSASNVKRPASLSGSGYAINSALVQSFISGSGDSRTDSIATDANGHWSGNFNPKLHLGNKTSYTLSLDGFGGTSEVSHTRAYEVLLSADLNVDNLVNLTDFSVLMYNYGTSSPPNVVADINDNGPVDLVDFSVMMFYWTGG